MSSFTLKQLEYFVSAVQAGSLTGAARACHVSHAGISNGLNELERAMGTQLLVRQKAKGVSPTAAGRSVLPLARRMLKDAAGIELIGQSRLKDLVGELSISCNLALSPVLIPLIASQFAEHHPNVELTFREGTGADVLQAVRNGQADVGLTFEGHLQDDLEYVSVCPIRSQAVLPASHRLALRSSISLSELAGEHAILAAEGPSQQAMLRMLREANVIPNVRWTFASPETIRAMVGREFGYSILNVRPPTSEPGNASVAYIPINDPISENALVMVLPPRRRQVGKVDKLAEVLRGDAVRMLIG